MKYNKPYPLISFITLLWLLTGLSGAPSKPNIIHIIVDDMGYSDLGCYGGEIETPHLDRLGKEGIRFTQFYNCAKCETTRASLMSGLWWTEAKVGMKKGITLGTAMQGAGYKTCAVGKWHLDGNPVDRGFDHYFGHLSGAADFFRGNESFRLDSGPYTDFPEGFYATDAFTDYTIDFIKNSLEEDPAKPFFVYLAYNAPHNPLQIPEDDHLKYRGKYLKGYKQIRYERYERMIKLGIMPNNLALPSHPENLPDWEDLTPAQQDLEDLRMAVFASMIDRIDQNVGKLVKQLEELGVADNTLIIFHSDNGTNPFVHADQNNLKNGTLPGERRSNWQLGVGWSYASSTPFRLYKRNQHEGGICSPLIVWHASMLNPKATINRTPLHLVDIMPTYLELGNQSYEEVTEGLEVPPLSGQSFAGLLQGGSFDTDRPLYFQFMDHRALRLGDWKLAAVEDGPWELYNLKSDRTERNDLIHSYPERADQMIQLWHDWWERTAGKPYKPRYTSFDRRMGDKGTGYPVSPTPMPESLKDRYPVKKD